LIQGESGTGKELVAKAIYKLSLKNDKPFIPVDCGSLSNDIIESELFGHIKGAFTGAISDKKGLFEEANGGTIFLDEISNISLSMQAKLLRVLQEGEIKRIGENTVRKVDVRIIAASNIDLKELVKTGNFREDLYFRLSTFPIFIPPLRERKEDIKILAVYFLNYFSKIHKKNIIGLTEEAYKIIYNYSWPGNVRELKNELERAVIMYNGNKKLIGASYFEQLISDDFYHDSEKIPIGNFNELVNEFKIKVIENAYQKSGKNWTKTAKMLGISRQNLNQIYKRLKHQS
jgi:transcriptional regulator with PAS, ATPase and Fis domain